MHLICIVVLHTWHKNICNNTQYKLWNIFHYLYIYTCRFVGIVFDEIYIREDLVYDKHTSKVIGFVNLGDVDRQLSALEFSSSQSPPTIATRIVTLMVRGVFSKLHFPLINFPTAGIRACVLHDILWEATELLERSDFIVCFQTGDGGSPHRRLVLGN